MPNMSFMRLARDRNEEIEGLNGTYALDLLMDGHLVKRFSVAPPKVRMDYESVDRDLNLRIPSKCRSSRSRGDFR